MRCLLRLPWYWRVPILLLALAYAVVLFGSLVSLTGFFTPFDRDPFRASSLGLLGLAALWMATISVYMGAGRRETPDGGSRADSWRTLCACLFGVQIAAAALCALEVARFLSDPTAVSDLSLEVTAAVAISVIALYAPLMARLVRAKLRSLAARENRCFYCGVDLTEHPNHLQEHCEASTRRGMNRRQRQLLRRRRELAKKPLRETLTQTAWWWYVAIAVFILWMMMLLEWPERWFGDVSSAPLLAGFAAWFFWLLFVVPFLDAGRARFGRRGEEERGGLSTPTNRCRDVVRTTWLSVAFFSLILILVGSLTAQIFADMTGMGPLTSPEWWIALALLMGSLLLIAWALWAEPRLERRVRRSAWRAVVCYDCGESLSGVTSPICPQCEAKIERPAACPRCGYDISHSAGGACPECGQLLPPSHDGAGRAGGMTDTPR